MKFEINRKPQTCVPEKLKNCPEGLYLWTGTLQEPKSFFIVLETGDGSSKNKLILYYASDKTLNLDSSFGEYSHAGCISNTIKLVAE